MFDVKKMFMSPEMDALIANLKGDTRSAAMIMQQQRERGLLEQEEAQKRQQHADRIGLLSVDPSDKTGWQNPDRMQALSLLGPDQSKELLMQRMNPEPPKLPTGMRWGDSGPEWIPNYLEGKGQIAQQGATTVKPTFHNGNDNDKYYDAIGKNLETRTEAYRTRGNTSRDLMNSLLRFERAMAAHGETGPLDARVKTLREFAGSFGYPIDEKALSTAQGVDQAAKLMVADQLRMNKGPQTDFDARFASEYMPSLAKAGDANREAVRYMKSTSRLGQIFANLASGTYDQGDFKSSNSYLTALDRQWNNTPAVIQASNGKWVMFEEFYRSARREGMNDRDILAEWSEEASNARMN